MLEESALSPQRTSGSVLHRFMHYTVSFFCAVGAFFIIKLGLLVVQLVSMVLVPTVAPKFEIFAVFLLIFAVVGAYKFTKSVNRYGSTRKKNWVRIAVLVCGFVAMLLSTVIVQLGKTGHLPS